MTKGDKNKFFITVKFAAQYENNLYYEELFRTYPIDLSSFG